jgi:hypothetical protein
VDGFGRSLDRGYEANTRTATIETTSFHLIIEKPRCVLLRLIDAPHTAGILVGARRRGGLQQRGIFSFWTRVGSTVTERISIRWRRCSAVLRRSSPSVLSCCVGAHRVKGLKTCQESSADLR